MTWGFAWFGAVRGAECRGDRCLCGWLGGGIVVACS